jgi:hypothetical protein
VIATGQSVVTVISPAARHAPRKPFGKRMAYTKSHRA